MNLRAALTFNAALVLTACSSGLVKNEETVNSNLTIEQFLDKQFLSTMPWMQVDIKAKDGGILYEAFFTVRNPRQLGLPFKKIKMFCEANGGSFARIEASKSSARWLATPEFNKTEVYFGNRAAYRSLGFDPKLADLTAAYEATLYERLVQAYYPPSILEALATVEQLGAFGKFGCERIGQPIWAVAIEPARYNPPSDPSNLLSSPSLTIYLKGTSF